MSALDCGMVTVATHLMFEGRAAEALALYAAVFPDFRITEDLRDGDRVTIAHAALAGHQLIFVDDPIRHAFTFTPSMSLHVFFDDRDILDTAFAELSKDGEIRMALDDYGFSPRFGWTDDRFGVSWQLNLSPKL